MAIDWLRLICGMSVLPKLWYAAVMIRLRNDAYSMIANFTRCKFVCV